MCRRNQTRRYAFPAQAGMTLIELIIACSILLVLATAAMPVARFTVMRQKESELRRSLREIRDAIDRYKDTADRNRDDFFEIGLRKLQAILMADFPQVWAALQKRPAVQQKIIV